MRTISWSARCLLLCFLAVGILGRADDSGRPMTTQTPVLLASTSKSLTAIAVMQQVEAGRLRLDDPIQTYLPWFHAERQPRVGHHGPLTLSYGRIQRGVFYAALTQLMPAARQVSGQH